jgi:hypothetical protein
MSTLNIVFTLFVISTIVLIKNITILQIVKSFSSYILELVFIMSKIV